MRSTSSSPGGGSITGVVRNEDEHPLAGAYISASLTDRSSGFSGDASGITGDRIHEGAIDISPEGRILPAPGGGWAISDEDGAYRMSGLQAGEYRIQFQYATRWQHVLAWYDVASSYEEATPIVVATGQRLENINMTLQLPVAASAISGRVTDASGRPVPKAFVTVQTIFEASPYDSMVTGDDVAGSSQTDDLVDEATVNATDAVLIRLDEPMGSRTWAYVMTQEDGSYVVDELPAGTYIVSAATENGWEYVQRWYPDARTPRDATEFVVGEAERLTDIDIILPVRVATASIAGSIRNQDGQPLRWAFVEVGQSSTDAAVAAGERNRFFAYGQTDELGSYQIERLPAGTYTVHASYRTGDTFGESWYDGADSPEASTPLTLADDESLLGIDMELVVRPLYGSVTGMVTDVTDGAPIGRAYVELSPLQRETRRGAVMRYEAFSAVTDKSGTFHMGWIPEGAYSLTVYANGGTADYVHPDTDALSTPFEVVGGESTIRNVAIALRADGDGVITGQVSLGDAGPIWYTAEEPDPGIVEEEIVANTVPVADQGVVETAVAGDRMIFPDDIQTHPQIAVVVAFPTPASDAGLSSTGAQYVAVTDTDGSYALHGLALGDYTVMCFAPGHIGTYYEGEYDPQRARPITVDDTGPVSDINFELVGYYRIYLVADDAGAPVQDATVYLLNAQEQPVAFAQTGSDGNFEFPGIASGECRVYASRVGFTSSYNDNEPDFAAAQPLGLDAGQLEVNLVLVAGIVTVVEEEAQDTATPTVMALHRNYPNPFNPETRITFSVPTTGHVTLTIHNALGQRVATLHDGLTETGRMYEVMFQANQMATGVYFYVLDFDGQQLTRSMLLVR